MDNDIHKTYTHLLTGYVGSVEFLRELSVVVKTLREHNPEIVYRRFHLKYSYPSGRSLNSSSVLVCDPVLGDNGHLYVPESFVGIYRDELLPLAHISTPNQFEAELLSGIKIEDETTAWRALDWFHGKGVHTVVLSSTNIGSPTHLKAFLSCKKNGVIQRYSIVMPKLGNCNFTGTGDLFAALFFAHYSLETEASQALEKTVATVQSVIANTIKDFDLTSASLTQPPTAFQRELKIVRSKREIECPTITIKCEVH